MVARAAGVARAVSDGAAPADDVARDVVVLVPARDPGPALAALVDELLAGGAPAVLVVDDGSRAETAQLFEALAARAGVRVLRHAVNLGKGRAIKTGINDVLVSRPDLRALVTADADGQHTARDVLRAIAAFGEDPTRLLIGARRFDGDVPLRSRAGNAVTTAVFRFLTGRNVSDTQSGLRVFPAPLLADLLSVEGERYEYEMSVLSHVCRLHAPREIPIETIYLDGNAASHFDPVRDSLRISFVLLRFYASSLAAAGLDTAIFAIVFALTASVPISFAAGRSSSLANFAINRGLVFHSRGSVVAALVRYYALAAVIAATAYASIDRLTFAAHWNVFAAKLVVETLLSLVSFLAQRSVVFTRTGDQDKGF